MMKLLTEFSTHICTQGASSPELPVEIFLLSTFSTLNSGLNELKMRLPFFNEK